MPISAAQIASLRSLAGSGTVLTPESAGYRAASVPWSVAYDRRPAVVVQPRREDELARILAFLATATTNNEGNKEALLDFAVRGSGCGSSSAADVVVSMAEFRDISFDPAAETLDVGAGNDWGDVDTWLEKNAPGYVVGSRCPYVGVAGSTLMGGLSWLSHSMGLGSDPSNLLDVRIALLDGRVVWASTTEDSELLWALRGGGGNFGVAVTLRFRAHRYHKPSSALASASSTTTEPSIWSGLIRYPDAEAALPAVSRGVAAFAARNDDAHLALHVFVIDFSRDDSFHSGGGGSSNGSSPTTPSLVLLPFDEHGEEHARSSQGFAWALDIPGADASACRTMRLADVHELQRDGGDTHAQLETWLVAALVGGEEGKQVQKKQQQQQQEGGGSVGGINGNDDDDDEEYTPAVIDEGFVERCWHWYKQLAAGEETRRFAPGAFALLEIMQKRAMCNDGVDSGATTTTIAAWPHAALGRKNVLQLSVGCRPGASAAETRDNERRALDILAAAPAEISGRRKKRKGGGGGEVQLLEHPPGHYLPNFTLPYHDLSAIFGDNWDRLRKVKTRYDPRARLNKGFLIPPA